MKEHDEYVDWQAAKQQREDEARAVARMMSLDYKEEGANA